MRFVWVCASILALTLAGTGARANVTLVSDGKSDYCVIVAKNASPSEHRAAAEFKKFIAEITGAHLRDVDDGPNQARLRYCWKQLLAHKNGAGDEARTRDIQLGRLALYQLSYSRSTIIS